MAEPSPPTERDAILALEMYQRRLEAVSRQLEFMQGVYDDVVRARRTLEGLSEEKSRDVLVPVGSSTFVRASVRDEDVVLTGIGAGYATERTRSDSIARLTQRETSLQTELQQLAQAAVQLQQEAARLQDALEEE